MLLLGSLRSFERTAAAALLVIDIGGVRKVATQHGFAFALVVSLSHFVCFVCFVGMMIF